jgi:hypothetical protein
MVKMMPGIGVGFSFFFRKLADLKKYLQVWAGNYRRFALPIG